VENTTPSRRFIADLANLEATREAEAAFTEKHGVALDHETISSLKDTAQTLWSGGSDRSFDALREILLPFDRKTVGVDWKARSLSYQPGSIIQAGFYYLLQNAHLAKRCANECSKRFFFAKRPNERYCSSKCFTEAQRKTKREWWEAHAEEFKERRKK